MTPRVIIMITRLALVGVLVAAFTCAMRATDANFTAFVFLKVALAVLLLWSVPRLGYDAAQVFLQVPLPQQRIAFVALVLADWAAAVVLFAAVSSATAVLVFFRVDTSACGWVTSAGRPGACSHWYVTAAALTWSAWGVGVIIAARIGLLLVAVIDHDEH